MLTIYLSDIVFKTHIYLPDIQGFLRRSPRKTDHRSPTRLILTGSIMDTAVELGEGPKSRPIAGWWHTILLTVILLGIAICGAMFQLAHPSSPTLARNVLPVYMSLLISELVLVWAVWMGSRRTSTSLKDLIGGRWRTSRDVLVDVFLGIAFWAILLVVADAWDRLLPIAGHARSISPLLPQGPVEIAFWIPLSV